MMRTLALFLVTLLAAVTTAVAQKVSYEEFVQSFEQSLRLGDQKGLDRVVRDNPARAIVHFRSMNGALLRKADDAIALEQTKALKEVWQRVFNTATLDHVARWQETLDQDKFQRDQRAFQGLTQAYAELDRLRSGNVQDRRSWESLRDSLLKIAQAFESVGNAFEGADAWGLVAQVYIGMPEKTVTDRRESVYAIDRFQSLRESWEFTKDAYYIQNVHWMEAEKQRLASGEAEAEGGPGGDKKKAAEKAGPGAFLAADADAREMSAELEFSVQKKQPLDMCVQGGPVPFQWAAVQVQKQGPTKMPWFKATDLYMVRPSASRFGITDNGSVDVGAGKGWTEIEVSNRLKSPSEFSFGPDGAERPYAAWFYIGGSQESFQGYNQNLAPTPENAPVYYKSAGQWTAEIDGTDIVLFDDNSNGILFEDDPYAYGLKDRNLGEGPKDEVPVPAFDGMQIGRGVEQPFSEWIALGDHWYHVRGQEDGTRIRLRPADPEKLKTGSIRLDWQGPRNAKPAVLIVQGTEAMSGARFNIASGKPVEVPVGKYAIAFGRIESGKGARIMTASIFGGKMEPVAVKEGETASLEIGAPFTLDFQKRDVGAGAFAIDALTIRVRGKAGEVYAHVNGAAPAPAVLIARDQDGRGAKEVAEFVSIRDPEVAVAVANKHPELGNQVGYYPIADPGQAETVIEIDVPDGWFVGLKEDKNKLFGSLEAAYR